MQRKRGIPRRRLGVTVRNVESLFQSVLEQSGWGNGCSIRVVRDDSLRPEAVEESAA